MRLRRSMGAAMGALFLAGCASVRAPEVRLDDVRLGGLGLSGGTLHAEFWVYNPNRFTLEAASITYDLLLGRPDGDDEDFSRVAQGTYEERIRIGGRDSARVEIPVDFRYSGMGGAIRSLLDQGTFEYRVSGHVDLREPSRRRVAYRDRGRFDPGR